MGLRDPRRGWLFAWPSVGWGAPLLTRPPIGRGRGAIVKSGSFVTPVGGMRGPRGVVIGKMWWRGVPVVRGACMWVRMTGGGRRVGRRGVVAAGVGRERGWGSEISI